MGPVTREQAVPVRVAAPGLASWGHASRLGNIGHGKVGLVVELSVLLPNILILINTLHLGQQVLDPVEGTELVAVVAVLGVTVPLAPGEEEDWLGAGVGLLDGSGDGRHVLHDVPVHVVHAEAGPLGLVLDHHDVKVPVPGHELKLSSLVTPAPDPGRPDGVLDAPGDVSSQGLSPWRHHGGGGTLA